MSTEKLETTTTEEQEIPTKGEEKDPEIETKQEIKTPNPETFGEDKQDLEVEVEVGHSDDDSYVYDTNEPKITTAPTLGATATHFASVSVPDDSDEADFDDDVLGPMHKIVTKPNVLKQISNSLAAKVTVQPAMKVMKSFGNEEVEEWTQEIIKEKVSKNKCCGMLPMYNGILTVHILLIVSIIISEGLIARYKMPWWYHVFNIIYFITILISLRGVYAFNFILVLPLLIYMIVYLLLWLLILTIVVIDFFKAQANVNKTPETYETWGQSTFDVLYYLSVPHSIFALLSLYWTHAIFEYTLMCKQIMSQEKKLKDQGQKNVGKKELEYQIEMEKIDPNV